MSRAEIIHSVVSFALTLGALWQAWQWGHDEGIERGRELERMEPPLLGEVNFRDGWVRTVYAPSASAAIEQVTR